MADILKIQADIDATTKALDNSDAFKVSNAKIKEVQDKIDGQLSRLGIQAPKLDTVDGLHLTATRNGLETEANKIIQDNSGEEYKKIYSGGMISDIFDTLNIASYGVVGMLKGKGFMEGVKNRESFADKDALGRYGLVGTVAGIALDIATDPFTYIAPGKILTKIPGISNVFKTGVESIFGKTVTKVIDEGIDTITKQPITRTVDVREGGLDPARKLADSFVWMFGQDGVFKNTYARMMRNIGTETTLAVNLIKPLAKLDSKTDNALQKVIFSNDTTGRIIRKPLDVLQREVDAETFNIIKPIWNKIDDLGKQLVDEGVLSKTDYENNLGEYIHQYYKEYLDKKSEKFFGVKPIGLKETKARSETLTKEGMDVLGQVDNPSYLLGRTILAMTHDLENAKLLNTVTKNWAVDGAREGFVKIGTEGNKKWGQLAGKYIPEHMSKYIDEIIKTPEQNIGTRIISEFKFAKVVLSPATHVRNLLSNMVLNYWKLGIIPGDKTYFDALKEIKAGTGKYIDMAKKVGYGADTFMSQEIFGMLDEPDMWKGAGKKINELKRTIGNIYQEEENWAKLTAFIKQVKSGHTPEEAWKMAESATFNYAQITPFVRKMRTAIWGVPFITFPLKATPVAVETMLNKTGRVSVIGKIKNAIEEQSDIKENERERATEPSWIKDGFYVKLPFKDAKGRSAYFDLTYIVPFGDLVSGDFFARSMNRETGTKEDIASFALSKSPVFNFIKEISKNQDFYGNKIFRQSSGLESNIADLTRHLTKTFLPPPLADQVPGGYDKDGKRIKGSIQQALTPNEEANQKRTFTQELLKYVGAKTQPVDAEIQELMNENNRKKGLQTLLQERGIIKDFRQSYIPK